MPAGANHGGTTILVGADNTGNVGRANFDDSDLTGAKAVSGGTQIDFSFVEKDHTVRWLPENPAPLPDSPGGKMDEGSTHSVTMPATAGTYIYFCSIDSDRPEARNATDFSANRPDGMYGRIEVTVTADTIDPVWGAGTAIATPVSATQIDLSWPTATDDSGTVFYDVWRASGNSNPGKIAASLIEFNTSSTSLSDTGLTSGVHYWYWITPVDGAANTGPDLTADASPGSSALSVTIGASTLDLGVLSPASSATGSTTVTVQSDEIWSLTIKSTGRDGVDDASGDDPFFEADNGSRVPVGRATWDIGSGPVTLAADEGVALTAQPVTASTVHTIDFALALQFDDASAVNYRTTVLYTVTQP